MFESPKKAEMTFSDNPENVDGMKLGILFSEKIFDVPSREPVMRYLNKANKRINDGSIIVSKII